MKTHIIILISFLLILAGCGGGGGDAPQNDNTANNTLNSVVVSAYSAVSTAECPNGGISINTGIDENANGILDSTEIDNTQVVCNGLDGLKSLIRIEDILQGSNCPAGGTVVYAGTDLNKNNYLDDLEISTTNYICNAQAVISGAVYMVEVLDEAPGGNCINGGMLIKSGLDNDSSGTLELAEITSSKYVCDGETGTSGLNALVDTQDEPAGSNCEFGGVLVSSGIDSDGNGLLAVSEITSESYVCNGMNGGLNSLISTTTEPAGSNCTDGGIKISSGLDSDNDSILDSAEIISFSYVCNIVQGNDTSSNTYTSISNSVPYVTSFACSGSASTSTTYYYDLGQVDLTSPVKVCVGETCHVTLTNGQHNHHKYSGGVGCLTGEYEYINCKSGYTFDGTNCVSLYSTIATELECSQYHGYWWDNACHNYCQDGYIETSRGCELPVTSCTKYQTIADNTCVDVNFTVLSGDICGIYEEPVNITAGTHIITCDATFNDLVVIEPGASLLADDDWKTSIKKIYAAGTQTNHITVSNTASNIVGYSSIVITYSTSDYDLKFDPKTGYKSGNLLQFVDFLNCGLNIKDTYIDYIDTSGNNMSQSFTKVYINNSTLSGPVSVYGSTYPEYQPSYVVNSQIGIGSSGVTHSFGQTLIAWTSVEGSISLSYDTAIMYSNILNNVNCYYISDRNSGVYGNKVLGTVGTSCIAQDNSALAVSSKNGTYTRNPYSIDETVNAYHQFSADLLNASGWLNPSVVTWSLDYDYDGVTYVYKTFTGQSINPLLDKKESYRLYISDIDGSTDIIGNNSLQLNVW